MKQSTNYYLADPDGRPLDVQRYKTEDQAHDACVATYGAEAWNDTAILSVVAPAMRPSVEHDRLAVLSAYSHALLDALEVFTVAEMLEIRAEAEAMTPIEVEALLIELKISQA